MNILIATMRMGIGGAETHILELSKELVRRGNAVTVAAAGGEYVPELLSNGIKFVDLPLDKKDLFSSLRSRRGLTELIRRNRYDIVHAHARIPAFLLSGICRKLDVRFVTTAHFCFETTPLWRRLSRWGELTFSVSDEISDYLVRNYDVYRKNIVYVPNGIDFEKYSYQRELRLQTRQEWKVGKRKVILHVSRMDPPASKCSVKILEAAKKLLGNRKDLLFVLIGDGADFEKIQWEAKNINAQTGMESVLCLGKRKEIVPCLCAADVYIGPSRSALEALSVGIPTIVCSSEGLLGEISPETYETAERTNLCCAGCPESTAENISAALQKVLSLTKEEIIALIRGQNDFIQRYTVSRMTDIYLSGYNRVAGCSIWNKPDALVCGYYGCGNLGDEAMLEALVQGIRKADRKLCLCIMSKKCRETELEHDVDAIGRYNIFAFIKKIRESGVLILGGGNLLQNKTSNRSLLYYTFVVRVAKKLGAKVLVYANGFGPLSENKKKKTAEVLKLADYISVRENDSLRFCEENGIKAVKTADPVFSCDFGTYLCTPKNYFVVIPHGVPGETESDVSACVSALKAKYGLQPLIVSMHDEQDLFLCKAIASKTGGGWISFEKRDFGALQAIVKSADFVITSRYHAVLCCMLEKRAVVARKDAKLKAAMDEFGMGEFLFDSYSEVERVLNDSMTFFDDVLQEKLDRLCRENKEKAARDIASVAGEIAKRKEAR